MDKVRACPKIKNEPTSLYACFWWDPNLWDYSMQHKYYVKMFIIFMYLHENNTGLNVRFSILSNNFHKNNPKYYDAVNLSSFARGKNETITRQ